MGPTILNNFLKLNLPKNVHLTFDSYFTRKNHLDKLQKRKIGFTATFSAKNRGFQSFKSLKLPKGEIFCEKKDGINFVAFNDKRTVLITSNRHSETSCSCINKRKRGKTVPEMVKFYNHLKCGVDEIDKIIAIYESKRRERKWWKALFFYLMDIKINNAFIIYFQQNAIPKREYRSKINNFRNKLINEFFYLI